MVVSDGCERVKRQSASGTSGPTSAGLGAERSEVGAAGAAFTPGFSKFLAGPVLRTAPYKHNENYRGLGVELTKVRDAIFLRS